MKKIKNINEKFGDQVVFAGETLDDCIEDMAASVAACGYLAWNDEYRLEEGRDYEVMETSREVIKRLADGELVIEWSNDDKAEIDADGDVWFNGHWAKDDALTAFAEWLTALD